MNKKNLILAIMIIGSLSLLPSCGNNKEDEEVKEEPKQEEVVKEEVKEEPKEKIEEEVKEEPKPIETEPSETTQAAKNLYNDSMKFMIEDATEKYVKNMDNYNTCISIIESGNPDPRIIEGFTMVGNDFRREMNLLDGISKRSPGFNSEDKTTLDALETSYKVANQDMAMICDEYARLIAAPNKVKDNSVTKLNNKIKEANNYYLIFRDAKDLLDKNMLK